MGAQVYHKLKFIQQNDANDWECLVPLVSLLSHTGVDSKTTKLSVVLL